jgi:hypothetical protein
MAQGTVGLVAVMVVAAMRMAVVIPEATGMAVATPEGTAAVIAKSGSNTTSGGAHQLRRSI